MTMIYYLFIYFFELCYYSSLPFLFPGLTGKPMIFCFIFFVFVLIVYFVCFFIYLTIFNYSLYGRKQ